MIGNLLKYMCAKIVVIDDVLTEPLQKENGAVFLPHMVVAKLHLRKFG